MIRKPIKLALVGAALSASAVMLAPTSGAFAAAEGPATLSVSSGTATTAFNMTLPAGAACTGGGAAGYRWDTFIASSSIDVGTLVFTDGPNVPPGTFTSVLTDTFGTEVKQKFPSASPAGLISGIPQMNFNSLVGSGITSGTYKVGVFCSNLNAATPGSLDAGHYWEKLITVTDASTMTWSAGAVPPAITLAAPTSGDGTCAFAAGAITTTPADPAATYAATTVPATVSTPVTPGTAFTLTGLTNGTAYTVTVTATNSVGSTPSNGVACSPNFAARPPITGLTASQISGPGVHLTWVAPTGTAPTNYTVVFTPSVAGSPFTAPGTTLDVTGLTDGTPYSIAVTANYAAAPTTGPTATTSFTYAGAIIIQDLTVVRPAGALILTQRCGVNGALPAEPATAAGFPATAAVVASADQTGTAPTTGAAPGGPADPQFPAYPFPSPATYPTHCGVNLGTGSFITTGALAGQYLSLIHI